MRKNHREYQHTTGRQLRTYTHKIAWPAGGLIFTTCQLVSTERAKVVNVLPPPKSHPAKPTILIVNSQVLFQNLTSLWSDVAASGVLHDCWLKRAWIFNGAAFLLKRWKVVWRRSLGNWYKDDVGIIKFSIILSCENEYLVEVSPQKKLLFEYNVFFQRTLKA